MIFTDRSCRYRCCCRVTKFTFRKFAKHTFTRALIKVQHLLSLSLSYSLSPLDYITTSAIINSSSITRLTGLSSGWTRLSWTRVAFTRSRCGRQSQLQAVQLERKGGEEGEGSPVTPNNHPLNNEIVFDKVGWLLDLWIHLAAQFKRNQNKSTEIHCANKLTTLQNLYIFWIYHIKRYYMILLLANTSSQITCIFSFKKQHENFS